MTEPEPPKTVPCILDGRLVRASVDAIGITIEISNTEDGYYFGPVDNGQPITADDWPAWCEANRERIIAALMPRTREKTPAHPGQLDLY